MKPEVSHAIEVFSEQHFWQVTIGEFRVAAFRCDHQAKKLAERLSTARDRPQREAMHLLTEELGMCEQFAKHVYSAFFGEAQSTRH